MKVPNPVAPSVDPSSQGLAYFRPANTGLLDRAMSGIASNLSGIGTELGALDERQQKTLEANARLQSYSDLSDLHTSLAQDLTKLKTDTSATENFPGIASEHISPKIDEFVSQQPKPLQPEMRYRAEVIKNSLLTDAHEFQDKQAAVFAQTHVEDANTKAANTLRQNPTKDELKAQQAIVYQSIDAAPIDPASKVLEKRKADLALTQIVFHDQYNQFYQKQIADAQAAVDAGKTGAAGGTLAPRASDTLSYLQSQGLSNHASIALVSRFMQESNLNTGARGDFREGHPTAFGIAQWRGDRFMALRQFAADRGTSWTDFKTQVDFALHELGTTHKAAGDKLRSAGDLNQAIDATYDYESPAASRATERGYQLKQVARLAGGGADVVGKVGSATGFDVGGGNVGKAVKYDYSPAIENDPTFANIPLEDRMNLQNDAFHAAQGVVTAQNAAQKQLLDTARNQRYMQAEFGSGYGQTQFDQERQSTNLWKDFGDAEKMQHLLDEKNKKGADERLAVEMERTNAPFVNTEEGKKLGNALFTVKGHATDAAGNDLSGLDRLANGDHDYVANTLIPTVQHINMIPPNVSSVLSAYTISGDPKRWKFGFDTLLELKNNANGAFNVYVPEEVRKDVAFYEQHKSTERYTDEQLFAIMHPGPDDPNRQYEAALREKAGKVWNDGTLNIKGLINAATAPPLLNGKVFASPAAFPSPKAEEAAMADLKTVFEDEYVRSGDAKAAFGLASEWFNTVWAQNNVGGELYMMKHPPQTVGYHPMSGSLDWMTRAGHDELHIPPDHTFRLMSDQQTADEYAKWQHDPAAPPASYVVIENSGANGAGQMLTEGEVQKRLQRLPSEDTIGPLHLTTAEQHLYDHHLDNIKQGKFVRQEDGSISTILDITMEQDGRYRIIPTVWDGQVLSQNAAIQRAAAEGWSNWPSYASEDEANARYNAMHAEMEKDVTASALADAQRTVPFSDPAQSGLAPYRMHFVPSAADQADQEQYDRWQNAKSKSDYYDQHVYEPAFARAGYGEHPVPQDIIDEHNALEEAAKAAKPIPRDQRAVSQEGIGSAQRFRPMPGTPQDTRAQPLFSPAEQQQLRITP